MLRHGPCSYLLEQLLRERVMRRRIRWTALTVVFGMLFVGNVSAQEWKAPRGFVSLSFVDGDPVGELKTFIDDATGGQMHGAWAFADKGRLRLRGDLGLLIYGIERYDVCHLISCRINLNLETTNSIFYGGIGPAYAVRIGVIEPYVYATGGFSLFATNTSLRGDHHNVYDDNGWLDTTNYSDALMAWRVGGGMRFRLTGGDIPLSIDVGVERHQNGIANFLTEGDITDNVDGTINIFPNRSEANLMTFRIGFRVGFGGQ